MLIKYSPKHEHIKMVSLTPVEGVKPKRTLVQLLPGVNEVTADEFLCLRPNISNELDTGEIAILAQMVSAGPGKMRKARDLKDMPTHIAVSYVSECMNPETLLKWYKEEVRDEVRLHINSKLTELQVEIPKREIPKTTVNAKPMSKRQFEEFEAQDEVVEVSKDGEVKPSKKGVKLRREGNVKISDGSEFAEEEKDTSDKIDDLMKDFD